MSDAERARSENASIAKKWRLRLCAPLAIARSTVSHVQMIGVRNRDLGDEIQFMHVLRREYEGSRSHIRRELFHGARSDDDRGNTLLLKKPA